MTRLTDIAQHRKPVEEVVGGLLASSNHESAENGQKLVRMARDAGLSDAQITEVVAAVALNVLTNYFNNLAGTEIDFPRVAL